MAKRRLYVKSKIPKIFKVGEAACLACGTFLSYCGRPFSAEIECPSCGAINVYEDSQQPKGLKDVA
jgi:hypothetical protein